MIYENKIARVWVEEKIKVGDVVVIVEDVVPKHRWRLGVVVELIKSNVIRRPVNCLYPNEVCAAEKLDYNIGNVRTTKKKNVGNNNSTEVTRSKRNAVVAGELRRRLNDTDVDPV